MSPNARLITGVVCGVRVEDVTDPLMQQIRSAGLDERVRIVGHEDDMAAAFRAAHIAVVASVEAFVQIDVERLQHPSLVGGERCRLEVGEQSFDLLG